MERINWTDRVKNEEVLRVHTVKEERNILREIKNEERETGLGIPCVGNAL
jgi:hypothetical protein